MIGSATEDGGRKTEAASALFSPLPLELLALGFLVPGPWRSTAAGPDPAKAFPRRIRPVLVFIPGKAPKEADLTTDTLRPHMDTHFEPQSGKLQNLFRFWSIGVSPSGVMQTPVQLTSENT